MKFKKVKLLDIFLHIFGYHCWDDNSNLPWAGLNNSWCAICKKVINHGPPMFRGRYWGKEK